MSIPVGEGIGPQVNKSEQVFSDDHLISVAGGRGYLSPMLGGVGYPCPISKGGVVGYPCPISKGGVAGYPCPISGGGEGYPTM